ncbi:MAG: acylphosphatase [Candidatus Levyibacteriota bacterium]
MTVHVLISGFVQGVGFRHFVRKNARDLGITGYVKNLPDRRVEGKFSGDKEKVEELILLCKKGPFLSEVENVDVKNIPEEGFDSFSTKG